MDSAGLIRELRPLVHDEAVIDAIARVPRDVFVPERLRGAAWENAALPLPEGQSISQPLVVAEMCEMLGLRGGEKVLDVGTGSGYHAAVLSRLCDHVISIEHLPALADAARRSLRFAGVRNVTVITGDGSKGVPGEAPFDAINIAAASAGDPDPALMDQLTEGGRLIAPVEERGQQRLVLYSKRNGRIEREVDGLVRFVPLVSRA